MTTRRQFLSTGTIALAGTLLVGDAALEAFARLTHVRKSFPSAGIGNLKDWRYIQTVWSGTDVSLQCSLDGLHWTTTHVERNVHGEFSLPDRTTPRTLRRH